MKKFSLLFSISFILLINILAQPTIQWQRSLGGSRMDKINAVIRTLDNGYLLVGQTASINTQGRFDTMQAAVVRLNTEGGIVWQRNFGGTGIDIAHHAVQLPNGSFTVVGESTSRDIVKNQGGIDGWIFTIEEGGTLIRQTTFGGTGDESFKKVLFRRDSLVVLGYSSSKDMDLLTTQAKGGKDILMTRFTANALQFSGTKLYGGAGNDEGISFLSKPDETGWVVVGNTFSSNIDVVGNHGGSDIWAFEVTHTAGNIVWQRTLGGKNDEQIGDLIQNTEGYLLAGTTTSNEGDVKGFKGVSDIWAVQIDAKGTILRQNCIGGKGKDIANDIIADTVDKTFVIMGSTESKDGYVLSQHGASDWAAVKIDNMLKVRWHKCLGGSGDDDDCDGVLAKDGGILIAGSSKSNDGNVHFGDLNGNGWVVKLNRKNLSFYDDRQLIVRFRDGFTRDSALFYQKYYKARQINSRENDMTCAGLIQLWQIDTFPLILPNGDTLKDIIEVATVVRGKPDESNSDPNYAFSNGIDIDSIYTTPQYPTLDVYGSDSSFVLNTCQRSARDSAVILAIIDSGLDTIPIGHSVHQRYLWKNLKEGAQGSNSDLDGNGYKGDKIGWDFVENDAFPYDNRGHGSHVTGIIAKMLERHKGDSVKLMPLRIFDSSGNSNMFYFVQALTYAICNNANVVNMSLSYTADTVGIQKSIIKFLIDFGGTRQKLLAVAAAGNYSVDIDASNATERYCPAYFTSSNLLVVGSVNPEKALSSFSNYGKVSVDIAATGDNIFSTLQNNKWGFLSGTSMATPFVSASAALIGTKRCTNNFDFNNIKTAIENNVTVSTGLASIRKQGFLNFCAARQSFINTLPISCLVSVKETPSVFQRFSAKTNPFSSDLTIFIESSENRVSQLIVSDALGKHLYMQTFNINVGENTIPIETATWHKGIYFISLISAGKGSTLKVVKM